MNKQEKIFKGIVGMELGTESEGVYRYVLSSEDVSKIFTCLDSLDVVIKVDRKSPEFAKILPLDRYSAFNIGYVKGQEFERDRAFGAGYVAVMPLIKEVSK